MKIKNVFDTIFSMENLQGALEDACKGRRYKKDPLVYSLDAYERLEEIRKEVYGGTYGIDKYFIFYVHEPKKRMIMSIAFRHRIVQWAIYRVINPMLVKGYISDSYGCVPGKGALGAAERLQYWLQQSHRKGGTWYYLKLDISKYFYRVSHRILKKVLAKKIKDERLLRVLNSIIDCEHTPFGLPQGCSPGDVSPEERLYDVGMPIGNLMSQVFANVYLDVLDQHCKRKLGIHYYIRYMDDVIILDSSKARLRRWKAEIGAFLKEELELDLNGKTCIRPVSHGIEFVGYRIWWCKKELRRGTSLRIKRALKGIMSGYGSNKLTLKEAMDSMQCYIGMMEHCDSRALRNKILGSFVLKKERTGGNMSFAPCSGAAQQMDARAAPAA